MPQSTNTILLITPTTFTHNPETAPTNPFQTNTTQQDNTTLAQSEFQSFATALKTNGINVHIFNDPPHPPKPDAVFPNNWLSTHEDGTVILYPMQAPNRRHERRADIVEWLQQHFVVSRVIDLSTHEAGNRFLEGTGSIVFDHQNKTAYASLSPRTDKELFIEICSHLNYKPIHFTARDAAGTAIYHTNVMMCVGEKFAVVCLDSITGKQEREEVYTSLHTTAHEVINISHEQMNAFAGNMLELTNNTNDHFLVLSQTAFNSLSHHQRQRLECYCTLLPIPINTIEAIGGGSARCMMAEIFLEPLN